MGIQEGRKLLCRHKVKYEEAYECYMFSTRLYLYILRDRVYIL
jgi:hypothetical protein